MFNRTYQLRARRQGGGISAADALLGRPWAGIFEKQPAPAKAAAGRCKKGSRPLQGVQLELFAARAISTPTPASVENIDSRAQRPLFDIFPEAYQ